VVEADLTVGLLDLAHGIGAQRLLNLCKYQSIPLYYNKIKVDVPDIQSGY